ncbi:MAG: LLM class flavin-dependent oxidoreductase [bacterium]|nr:LLM class flavin-dependent oxidoreductase [bacterium]
MPPDSIPYSILDLSPIIAGGDAAQSFRNTLDLAQHAERLGYKRYWLAEHHGMPGIASAATSVVLSHVAQGTERIRVGAGGIMLPNHSPLVIAEQFGTLESLYPGRIDLGLGRAPGSDQKTAKALRRSLDSSPDAFPRDVVELQNYFQPPPDYEGIRAVPGDGLDIPIWILGSSLFGAQLAAALGLPYAFASHFAPGHLTQAMQVYRNQFSASTRHDRPYFMPALNVVAADTDEEAELLASSMQQAFVNLVTRGPMPLPAPVQNYAQSLSPTEIQIVNQTLMYSAVGSRDTVADAIARFIELTGADELMITAHIYDQEARKRSVEIAAEILRELPVAARA